MKIMKGWSAGAKRWIGNVIAEGAVILSRSYSPYRHDTEVVYYTVAVKDEYWRTVEVEMTAQELFRVVMRSPAGAALLVCGSEEKAEEWRKNTQAILGWEGGGVPMQ
jgi:hypothetical protein